MSRFTLSIYNTARQVVAAGFHGFQEYKTGDCLNIVHLVVLPGDGIGPEISSATVEVLELLNRKLSLGLVFETHEIGLARLKREKTTFPASVFEACRSADGILLGPVSHAVYPSRAEGGINVSRASRLQL